MTDGTGSAAAARKRGRPSTGARERILAAATDVLKAEGYAGLTFAKVAARAGESKALVAYHYGSKHGLVAEVGRDVAELITNEVLGAIAEAKSVKQVIAGTAEGVEALVERDPRLARLYFDLAAVSVVDPEIRGTIAEVNAGWRTVVSGLLQDAGVPPARAKVLTVMVIAGVQGLALERIERGVTPELKKAQDMFIRSAVAAASAR
jgi:AcrR family transcriptional regulator